MNVGITTIKTRWSFTTRIHLKKTMKFRVFLIINGNALEMNWINVFSFVSIAIGRYITIKIRTNAFVIQRQGARVLSPRTWVQIPPKAPKNGVTMMKFAEDEDLEWLNEELHDKTTDIRSHIGASMI